MFRLLSFPFNSVEWIFNLSVYNVTKHPKYVSGEWTEEQIFLKFLESYDTPNEADGKVSFIKYNFTLLITVVTMIIVVMSTVVKCHGYYCSYNADYCRDNCCHGYYCSYNAHCCSDNCCHGYDCSYNAHCCNDNC